MSSSSQRSTGMLEKLADGVFLLCLNTSLSTDSVGVINLEIAVLCDLVTHAHSTLSTGVVCAEFSSAAWTASTITMVSPVLTSVPSTRFIAEVGRFAKRPMNSINRGGFSGFVNQILSRRFVLICQKEVQLN
ncbi:hypothetical protein DPMN_129304 [Dreissena polymorpha]|uniref:Uncharacterized protein n=1 Tax=Dreissena polymorpha TaxID=45954 RepID=A0A9D4H4M7_DREPO|nr:hypothetical protein DPMN_129304 [Dreissena polymorpha]